MASTVCQASVLYEYEAKDDRLLTLQQDQNLIVIEKLSKDPNWLYAITDEGLTGFVPSNYVFKSTELDTQLADKTLSALQKTSDTHNEFQKKAVRLVSDLLAVFTGNLRPHS